MNDKFRRNPKGFFVSLRSLIYFPITIIFLYFGNRSINDNVIFTSSQKPSSELLVEGENNVDTTTNAAFQDPFNPLAIPRGQAPNLPSIRLKEGDAKVKRRNYGGAGDKQHLGGFSEMDPGGINPHLFKHMIEKYGVKSLLDIGCGRGFSTSWFLLHGVDAMCAEGSHDAVERTIIPDADKRLVEHDFSRGPWWPEKTYDVAWSVEFLEHVGVQYHFNYVSSFRKAALIFVTFSRGAGFHHVEVHQKEWWLQKYESYGFKYDDKLTEEAKNIARQGKKLYKAPNGRYLDGFYMRVTLMVFVNPAVASLPQHAHLFPEHGCYDQPSKHERIRRPCSLDRQETPLPDSFLPLKLTESMDEEWLELVRKNVKGMPKD